MNLLLMLTRQWEFMFTFWTFRHAALNEGWAAGAREGSAVGYVKSEAASRTLNYSFSLGQRNHYGLVLRRTVCCV
ncbi:MAG: hypothetical protein AOA66_1410 [Candidatus Bathyarchaeota archaeon BA2]|nr:MAG: hypothetical protein AOA66_1410 [Candidatus Bathyarchaeota archaeon BA2]